jgi:hypothetical protein
MIEKTGQLLNDGEEVVCEGSFSWYGNFCAADILKREKDGYALYEVKNTHTVRNEFLKDLGFQRLILRKCGVKITACHLILRGDAPDGTELSPIERADNVDYAERKGFRYKIVDVTKETKPYEWLASEHVFELGKLKRKDAPEPNIPIGYHCDEPYRCWYYEHCHGEE